MHSLHGQNVFLPSSGLKSRIIQDYSIKRYCEDVRLNISPVFQWRVMVSMFRTVKEKKVAE